MINRFVMLSLSSWSLTVLALILPRGLRRGLRRAQARHLVWGFWINDGSVAALQVLSDARRVTVAVLQFTLQEVLVQLRDAL